MDLFLQGVNLIDTEGIDDNNPTTILKILDLLSYQNELKNLKEFQETKRLFKTIVRNAKKTKVFCQGKLIKSENDWYKIFL